jgi:receptor protein-tyrosine kinase
MLIPKASHLVERVAERLLRSGALDDSAAQLLSQPGAAAGDGSPVVPNGAGAHSGADRAAPSQRSSLFAPPPSAAPAQQPAASAHPAPLARAPMNDAPMNDVPMNSAPMNSAPMNGAPINGAGGTAAETDFGLPPDSADAATPVSDMPTERGPALPSPAILAQARLPTPDRPADFASPDAGAALRGLIVDPAASPLQGQSSVDAVSLERAGMVDWSRTRTRISEEFRLVQRQIIRSAFGPGAEPGFSNLLLVTSARPGEGKSFMATNLAGSIARQGDHHVLLVDADSKRDSICYSLGLAQARGLLDLAANPKLDPAPLIVKTPIERLSVLPVGRERERSAELFSTKEMTRLIQSLGRRYADRLLILDAPPCLSTSDPAVLAQVVGQILFVVEADRTQRDEIEASLDLIQACPTITMVLNKQQISSRYTFGAYSSYYSS